MSPCCLHGTYDTLQYFSFDAYAARKSGEFLKRMPSMSREEMSLVESNCLRRQGELSQSISILRELCDTVKSSDGNMDANVLACALYQLGRALRQAGELDEAHTCFQQCIDLGKAVTREKYTIPHSLLEIGMLHLNSGEAEEAMSALVTAKKYSSYDFDKPNLRRIMRCLDRAKEMVSTSSARTPTP